MPRICEIRLLFFYWFICWVTILSFPVDLQAYPVEFVDDRGNSLIVSQRPARVVSLVPSVSEILFRIGAGDVLQGVTYHTHFPSQAAAKQLVGGYFRPSMDVVESLQPDVIFYSSLHQSVQDRFGKGPCLLVNLEARSISDSFRHILLLGRIFDREEEAERAVREIKEALFLIAQKVEKIPREQRRRVIRLMGGEGVMTPGDDSFQNEMIRAAGGIAPVLGKEGAVVPVSREEWLEFNPQVIFGCKDDRHTAEVFLNKPGWKDVEAVQKGKIFFFPCDLTCRVSTQTGTFVSWLAARIYPDEFGRKENRIMKDEVLSTEPVNLDLDYIQKAMVARSRIQDFPHKTLIIDFKKPLTVVSTLEGKREGIETVGNHYASPPFWALGHRLGLEQIREQVYQVIGRTAERSSFLFTGADMDHLAVKRFSFRDTEVIALVTAGAESNALRTSKDEGRYYESGGTINILLLPNMKLTSRAMTRALITATEAKTSALQDLDVRSSETSPVHQATGTGTDNIVVVEGTGRRIDNCGGHSKMGELIARAVYGGVQEALKKQNALVLQRNIFRRLEERKIGIFGLVSPGASPDDRLRGNLAVELESLLLIPRYTSFISSAMALSDDYERGLVRDLSAYKTWCDAIAKEIAGRDIPVMKDLVNLKDGPVVLRTAFNALLNGLYFRDQQMP